MRAERQRQYELRKLEEEKKKARVPEFGKKSLDFETMQSEIQSNTDRRT